MYNAKYNVFIKRINLTHFWARTANYYLVVPLAAVEDKHISM